MARRFGFTSLAVLSLACGLVATGAMAAPKKAYVVQRDQAGHPMLDGLWTNVSMTPEQRPAKFGTRGAYTPDEVKAIESAAVKEVADGNQNVDPDLGAPKVGGEAPPAGTRPEFVAASGGTGGYDRGWLDPGSHVMRVGGEARTSVLITPDGRVPKLRDGAPKPPPFKLINGGLGSFDNPEERFMGDRCILSFGRNGGPPMLANGFYNNNYQIVQAGNEIAISMEMVHDVRHIRVNGVHRTDGIRPYFGDSIGHWEGDTLVVETINIPQIQAYYGSWKTLKVVERFQRVSPHRLRYAFTVEDPVMWEKPWGGEYEFNTLDQPLYEYACHEGNYAFKGMMAGARKQEADAAAKAAGKTVVGTR